MRVVDWPTEAELAGAGVRAAGPLTPDDMSALVEGGAVALALPLHGARAEVHDWVAGEEGSFRATLDDFVRARSHAVPFGVSTRLVRSNARVIDELPTVLKARGARVWVIDVPGDDDDGPARPSPMARLGMTIPAALAAIERARRIGLAAFIRAAPRCALGRFADRALPSPPRAYADVCEGCPSRTECPGVDARYLEQFGAGELRPAPRAPRGEHPLAELFG